MTWKDIKDRAEQIGVKDNTEVFYSNYSFGGIGDEFDSYLEILDGKLIIQNPGGCDCDLE